LVIDLLQRWSKKRHARFIIVANRERNVSNVLLKKKT
jgi:hypothetical protein